MSGTPTGTGTPTDTAPRPRRVPARTARLDGHVTLPRVVASEWLKFRSLRSTPMILLAAMVAMVVFGAVIVHNTRNPRGWTRRTSSRPVPCRATTWDSCCWARWGSWWSAASTPRG